MWDVVIAHWRAWLVVVALACSCGGGFWLGYRVERPVIVAPTFPTAQATAVAAKVDTQWHTRDSVLIKTLAHWDTLRDSIAVHDTVLVPWFNACDSLASSCRAFRDTSVLIHRADSVVVASLKQDLAQCHAAIPTPTFQTRTRVTWATVGAGATYIALHLLHH